jgi:hypothetical protein
MDDTTCRTREGQALYLDWRALCRLRIPVVLPGDKLRFQIIRNQINYFCYHPNPPWQSLFPMAAANRLKL